MDAHQIITTTRTAIIAGSLALLLAGCKSKPATDDASLTAQVQGKLASDQNLSGQPIQATVASGVVTLNGSVGSDTARTIATGDVAQIAGVKTVVDNLSVQAPSTTATNTVAPAPTGMPEPSPAAKGKKPSAATAQPAYSQPASAPVVRNTPAPAPEPYHAQAAPPPPPPPPVPVVHNITLPAGTAIPVRITQTLDSATTLTGDKFTGVVATDLIADGMVVLPQGTAVSGRVDEAKDAAHYKGSSLLTISLTAINHKGEHMNVSTEPFTKQGEGRGKNTAEKVGGGAAVGAILGGIFGGGKGAAIGAAAGGGVGAGANTVTRGQQVQIPSESVVRFKLSDPVIVHGVTGGSGNSGSSLEHHTNW